MPNPDEKKRVIALGFFDGVHLGHAALLEKTRRIAQEKGAAPCALTFDAHPEIFITGHRLPLLNTLGDRAELLRHLHGMDEVIFVHFDQSLMHMPWKEFISDMLIGRFQAAHLVAGYDFHFGYRGEGNPDRLMEQCRHLGIGCDVVDMVSLDGIPVSSTYIRRLVAQGDIERARGFLGHPHILSGFVDHGRRIGSSIGVPTINMPYPDELQQPAHGVYYTRAKVGGGWHPSVTNIGVRPTIDGGDGQVVAETTILDFDGDLYGQNVMVEYWAFVRPEVRFPSLEALKEQIERDIAGTRTYFQDK